MKTTTLFSFMIIYTVLNGTVIGTVKDFKTKKNSYGAQIIVNEKDTVYTKLNGTFIVNNVDSITTFSVSYPPDKLPIIANN